MSRLKNLFEDKKERVLNVYCTAGFPLLDSTMEVMMALQEEGADIIEIGIPYSDPLADGPVIQGSGAKALQNGMNIALLFDQLKEVRKTISVPIVLMGYLNPLLQFGFENFCVKAEEAGIDGLIIPDIPIYEYEEEFHAIVKKHNLDFIFLVTPETTDERIKKLDSLSSGFLYAVSSSSVTGAYKNLMEVEGYLQRLRRLSLTNPILVGFGISDKKSFDAACAHSHGAIIGSAYIKALANGKNIKEATAGFISSILI